MLLRTWILFFLMPIAYILISLICKYLYARTKPSIKQILIDTSIALITFIVIHELVQIFFSVWILVTAPASIWLSEFTLTNTIYFILELVIVIVLVPVISLSLKKYIYNLFSISTEKNYYIMGIFFSMIAYFLPLYVYITHLMWVHYRCLFCYFVNL